MQITPQIPDVSAVTPPRKEPLSPVPVRIEPGSVSPNISVAPASLAAAKMIVEAQRTFDVVVNDRSAYGRTGEKSEPLLLAYRGSSKVPSSNFGLSSLAKLFSRIPVHSEPEDFYQSLRGVEKAWVPPSQKNFYAEYINLYNRLMNSGIFLKQKIFYKISDKIIKQKISGKEKKHDFQLNGILNAIKEKKSSEIVLDGPIAEILASQDRIREILNILMSGAIAFDSWVFGKKINFRRYDVWKEGAHEGVFADKGVGLAIEFQSDSLGKVAVEARGWNGYCEVFFSSESDLVTQQDICNGLASFLDVNPHITIQVCSWQSRSARISAE